MLENVKRMSCGNCGGNDFAIYTTEPRSRCPAALTAECLKCKSTTLISVSQPTLTIDWGKDSEGVLCVMP